jgi:superfamily II DNA or RNA helicase
MLVEEQISARQERGKAAIARILARPAGQTLGDYRVKAASGKVYRIALRGTGFFENFCSCPDFAVNTLGTCKHIEGLLMKVGRRRVTAGVKEFRRERASLSLQYGDRVAVRLRLPGSPSEALLALAREYFDEDGLLLEKSYARFEEVLERLRTLDDQSVIYSDVLEFLERENEVSEGLAWERRMLSQFERGKDPLAGVLKTEMLPYQVRGALFAASRGRVVLADDMGLGKTIQALAAAELLRRRRGIERVLVIAPASVKYQWKTEIEKFTELPAQVIDGFLPRRKALYAAPAFYNLSSYEVVLKDLEHMHLMRPDLVILDEAQRIRNWTTATARTIKQLRSRYAFVLTGTPLENKLEELFSVVEFVDGRRLGPAFRFLKEHRVEDEKGRLQGYRGLDVIHQKLEPILLRRTRGEVLKQLPKRTDQIFRVPLTPAQAAPYYEQSDILASIMRRWEQRGWISEIDLRRITCCIQNMRMLCNSTFLFDKKTHHSPKLKEFREIVHELVLEEGRKVVVFSEYERMTHLAGLELEKLGIGFVSLHGAVPGRNRGALMKRFREDPECRAFLSTDAGGVGLNLQSASAVINFEPPWNPARLEQRIGRVHRMGQAHPVHVVHFLTEESIEERVWETIQLKRSLFAGVFDSTASEVSFAKLGRKSVLQAVKEVFASQPLRPKPSIEVAPPVPVPLAASAGAGAAAGAGQRVGSALPPEKTAGSIEPRGQAPGPAPAAAVPEPLAANAGAGAATGAGESTGSALPPVKTAGGIAPQEQASGHAPAVAAPEPLAAAASGLLEAGIRFLETLSAPAGSTGAGLAERWLSNAFQTDPRTNSPILAVPLPESITKERLANALAGLLGALGRTS